MPTMPIPLFAGQQEGFDSRVAPDGTLYAVRELVTNRAGRWEKRNSYDELSQSTLGAIPTLTGEIWALGAHNDDRLIAYSQPPRLAVHDPDLDIVTSSLQIALPAFTAPQRYPVPHELGDGTAELIQTNVVYLNGWTVVHWVIGSNSFVGFYNSEGTLVAVDDPITHGGSGIAKLTQAGNYVVLIYPSSASALTARVWLSTTTGSAPGLSSFTTVASGVTAAGLQGYAAAEFVGAGYFIIAYESDDDPNIEANLVVWDPTNSSAAVDSKSAVLVQAGVGTSKLAINAKVGSGVLFAFWYETTGDPGVAYYHFEDNLDDDLTYTSIISSTSMAARAPSILWTSSTTWFLTADYNNTIGSSYDQGALYSYTLTDAGSVGSVNAHYDVRMVSQLFGLTDSTGAIRPYIIAVGDRDTHADGGMQFTQNYYIIALTSASFSTLPSYLRPQGFFGRDVAVRIASGNHVLANVATDGSGNWIYAGAYIAQGTALDRTEYSESVRLATAVWRFSSNSRDRFKTATLGRATYLSGGIMTRWAGGILTEAGFLRRPDIVKLTESGSGNLTQTGQYSYLATYESVTGDGEIVRSEPSTPATMTLTSTNDDITVVVRDNRVRSDISAQALPYTRVYVYRTLANQPGVYYMAHDQDDPIHGSAVTVGGFPTLADTASDAAIAGNPIIYSAADGTGLLPNVTPPPCRFLATVGKRLVAGGLEIPEMWWVSAEKVEGEQVNWKDDPAFQGTLPSALTAVGELDGYPVLFTAGSIHVLLGPGPDDTGVGLYEVRQIPTTLGAISPHVVTIDEGLIYQSSRGIELLPRGFGPPQWVGEAVADTLDDSVITSAVWLNDEVRLTFDGGVLVWDTENAWSVFALGELFAGSVWGGVHVVGYESYSEDVAIALELPGTPPNPYAPGYIETADIKMGAILGYMRTRTVAALFEYQGQCRVSIDVSYNGGQSWAGLRSFDLSDTDFDAGDLVPISLQLRYQKNDRFRFRIHDSGYQGGTSSTAGVKYLGIELDYEQLRRGLRPIRAGLRG